VDAAAEEAGGGGGGAVSDGAAVAADADAAVSAGAGDEGSWDFGFSDFRARAAFFDARLASLFSARVPAAAWGAVADGVETSEPDVLGCAC
jgi:hypothetical protein